MTQAKKIWKVESTGADKELCKELEYDIDTDDNSTLIARVGTLEDAKLIAQAPELLFALESLLREAEMYFKKMLPKLHNEWDYDLDMEIKRTKELIKKATK